MATYRQSFENGTTGATVDASTTSGSGVTAVSYSAIAAGSTFTFDTTRAAHGTKSAKIVPVAAGSTLAAYTMSGSTGVAVRMYLYLTGYSSDDLYLFRVEGATAARILSGHLQNDGKLAIRDGNASPNAYLSPTPMPLNQWVRVEVYGQVGSTTTNGTVKAAMYPVDSTTPIDPVFISTTANQNTAGYSVVQFGKANAGNYATTFWLDDVAVNTTASDFLGPWTSNNAPSVTAGADITVNVNSTANLSVTATDSDGSIAAYAWTFDSIPSGASTPTLTGGTTASATFTPIVGGTYVARITVTDNSGATNFDTMTVSVPAATIRPAAVSSNPGGWTNVGGAASSAAALADESDSTYTSTLTNPANAAQTFTMNGILQGGPVTVKVRADIDTAVAGTLVVDLMMGSSTVVATRTHSLTTTKQDFTWTTTTGETAAITDRTDLRVRVTANQT